MKLFVDTDPDTRLARRVMRDVQERGRDLEFVLNQYTNFVKPAFEDFCLPTKKYADVIIPRGADNEVAINLIMKHIESYLVYCSGPSASDALSSGSSTSSVVGNGPDLATCFYSYINGDTGRRGSADSDDSSLVASR